MATPSLYRRYRPRRFAELRGQDHVVRALRDAVAGGREGQAYLFSGPRGTGKTSSARILAKVLNCERPVDGEPCCECTSCLAVEQGTSFDVHELDAASNNGVGNIRDLIERASLGTPGRHKVYILDEVHMLSAGAEAALLKTLEEPPPHVVFVLATTDPQKVRDTIRSRTQHLRFHLLPPDELGEHIRWVAADAGLDVDEAAIDAALAQGGGSARDTLSALELIANAGGSVDEAVPVDELVEAMIDHHPGQALTAMAHAVNAGHEPRAIVDALVRHLRNGFLSLMAPELVQLSTHQVDELAEWAQRLGPAALVKGIERLGAMLVELRHAPDPRVLVEVALVQLTTVPPAADDLSALLARLATLEQDLAAAAVVGRTARTGRPGHRTHGARRAGPARGARSPGVHRSRADADGAGGTGGVRAGAVAEGTPGDVHQEWSALKPTLRGFARAVYTPVDVVAVDGAAITLSVPNATHRLKCEDHRSVVEQAWTAATGRPVSIQLVVAGEAAPAPPPVTAHDDSDVDLDDLVDGGQAPSALDRLAEAFPGAELIERDD